MKIAIIGACNVGSTLGRAWAKKGHDIFFGVRHPQDDKAHQLVQSIGTKAQAGSGISSARHSPRRAIAQPPPASAGALPAGAGAAALASLYRRASRRSTRRACATSAAL